MPCLSTDELYAYLGGELSSTDVERVQKHLDECTSCAARLARFENEHNDVLGKGYDAKAREWREKLPHLDEMPGYGKNQPPEPTSQPADSQPVPESPPAAESRPATVPADSSASSG